MVVAVVVVPRAPVDGFLEEFGGLISDLEWHVGLEAVFSCCAPPPLSLSAGFLGFPRPFWGFFASVWGLSLLGDEVACLPLVELFVDNLWHVSDPN